VLAQIASALEATTAGSPFPPFLTGERGSGG
jgi:hypothetical protein